MENNQIWEEKSYTQPLQNNCNQELKDNHDTTFDTKKDLIKNGLKDGEKVKICKKCLISKPIKMFSKDKHGKCGVYTYCKFCQKIKMDKWTQNNKKHIKEYHKIYNKENEEKRKLYQQKNKKHRSEYMALWRIKNKDHCKEYKRNYYNNVEAKDINKRLLKNLRGRLLLAVKSCGLKKKSDHTINLLGCNINQLKLHLEKQFKDGMSWNNYGKLQESWNIDHIIPCDYFDLEKAEEQYKCFHYTNLQPMWMIDNSRKNKFF